MTPVKTPTKSKDPIAIGQLAQIVNREINTIRKWEREEKLPKLLRPKRDERGRRYWTHAQVYGPTGIIAWMKKNDMRPGNSIADAANADKHVQNLRRPKYLDKYLVKLIRTMVKNKTPIEDILDEIFPHTKYASKDNLYEALRKYFDSQGWVLPQREQKKRGDTKRSTAKTRK
jgi:DNA-binding transcriptional MerR regulator